MHVVSVLLSAQQQQESVDPVGTGACINIELPLYYCSTVVATYGSECFVVKKTTLTDYSVLSATVNRKGRSSQCSITHHTRTACGMSHRPHMQDTFCSTKKSQLPEAFTLL